MEGNVVECTSCKSQIEFYKGVSFLCTVGWGVGGGGCNRKRTCDHHLQQYSVIVIALLNYPTHTFMIMHSHLPTILCMVLCLVLCLLQCVRAGLPV